MYKQNDANSSTFLCKMYGVEVYILFLETVLVSMYVFFSKTIQHVDEQHEKGAHNTLSKPAHISHSDVHAAKR